MWIINLLIGLYWLFSNDINKAKKSNEINYTIMVKKVEGIILAVKIQIALFNYFLSLFCDIGWN
jgi:hypothetical protein